MPSKSLIATAFKPRIVRPRSDMRAYQVRAKDWMKQRRKHANGSANWIDMGLGKTVSSLTALLELLEEIKIHKVLVVGPKKVVKNTWPEEIETWEHLRGGRLRYSVIVGTEKQRLAALRKDADLYLINSENLAWLERVLVHYRLLVVAGDHKKTPFDCVAIDEASLFKSRDSQRFKVMRRFSRIADIVLELTGTPATEGYHNLWSQFYLLDGGERLFPSFSKFESEYLHNIGTTEQPRFRLKSDACKDAIHEKIKDITFTLRADDYLKLPKEVPILRYVEMTPQERHLYDKMTRQSLIELSDGGVIVARSAAALRQKLVQLANGQVYDSAKNTHSIHRHKLEELQLIYDESLGEPMLVAYEYQHDRDLIAREFGAVLYDDNKATEDAWNDGHIPMMLIHPASGGHGVNIQFGGNILVRYGMGHSLEKHLQLTKRLVRPGQPKPFVKHYYIFTIDTVDDEIAKCVSDKNVTHEGLLNAMKKYVVNLHRLDSTLPTM